MDPVLAGFLGGLIPGVLSAGAAGVVTRLSRKHSLSTLYASLITAASHQGYLCDQRRSIFDELQTFKKQAVPTEDVDELDEEFERVRLEVDHADRNFRLAASEIKIRGSSGMGDQMRDVSTALIDLNRLVRSDDRQAFDAAREALEGRVRSFIEQGQKERRLWSRG